MKMIIDILPFIVVVIGALVLGLVVGFVYAVYRCDVAAKEKEKKEAGKDGVIVIDNSGGEFNVFANFANDPKTLKHRQILSMEVMDITDLPESESSQEKQPS